MKKNFFIMFVLYIIGTFCFALTIVNAEDLYYYPEMDEESEYSDDNNLGIYQKSQHQFVHDGYKKEEYSSPAIYMLLKNTERYGSTQGAFSQKYTVPYTKNEKSYVLAYCFDNYDGCLSAGNLWSSNFSRTSFEKSKIIKGALTRAKLQKIVKMSYPFITKDEMVQNMISAGVIDSSNNITEDEIIFAVEETIYNMVSSEEEPMEYTITSPNAKDTIIDNSPFGSNLHYYTESKKYDEVDKNIKTIMNYLQNLDVTEKVFDNFEISDVKAKRVNGGVNFYITTTKQLSEGEKINVNFLVDGNSVGTFDLASLPYENSGYVAKVDNKAISDTDVEVKFTGQYNYEDVYIYEDNGWGETNPSLIGYSYDLIDMDETIIVNVNSFGQTIIENPNTIVFISTGIIIIFIISIGIFLFTYKKNRWVKR